TGRAQPLGHVRAHPAEADHAQLHQVFLSVAVSMRWRAKSKPDKDAGSVRSRRLRARLRTPDGAALQPPERDMVAERGTYRSSNLTLATRRPRSFRVSRSPAACARISRRKPNGFPGIGSSSPWSSTTWRKRPEFGPPLWSWPVECWYRGP